MQDFKVFQKRKADKNFILEDNFEELALSLFQLIRQVSNPFYAAYLSARKIIPKSTTII